MGEHTSQNRVIPVKPDKAVSLFELPSLLNTSDKLEVSHFIRDQGLVQRAALMNDYIRLFFLKPGGPM